MLSAICPGVSMKIDKGFVNKLKISKNDITKIII